MSDKSVLCPDCGRFYAVCTCEPQYEPPKEEDGKG
jgi:hypothetical protein